MRGVACGQKEAIVLPLLNLFPKESRKSLAQRAKAWTRGLSLRMDNGSQYLSDHFINQIRFWGIEPSFAFVRQPETNGVAERFNRMLKEQAIHGHWVPKRS